MDILGGAEVDLFVPSFPELQDIFNLSPLLVENLLSINFISYSISIIFVGSLADRYGYKKIITISVIIFIIGSIFCTFASSYEHLFVGRLLQGIGVAAPANLCFLIVADLYSVKQQQLFNSILNAVSNIAVASAPIIGSYITLYYHWQGNFVALLILAIVILLMTLAFVPKISKTNSNKISLFDGYMDVFKYKPLIICIICIVSFFLHWWFFIGISPILYMESFGVPLPHFGFYQGSLALVFALGSFLSFFIMKKFETNYLLNISAKLCIFSIVLNLIATIFNSNNPLFITLSLIPFYVGSIIPFNILYPICINYLFEAKGKIISIIAILRLVITAILLSIAGYFYDGSYQKIGIIVNLIAIIALITFYKTIKNREFMNFEIKSS